MADRSSDPDSQPAPPSRSGQDPLLTSAYAVSLHEGIEAPPDSEIDFAGWGTVQMVDSLGTDPIEVKHLDGGPSHKLGELASTAICGNDITSSCLYVAALCAIQAGPYAFLCLFGVAAMLYLFRNIYAEVCSALPLNGGAYNALLNTTSKYKASLAACLTILSYLATAVISATEAMHYLKYLLGKFGIPDMPVVAATVGLLTVFALLSIIGITESAKVAIAIFGFHILTLVLLVGAALIKFGFNTEIFMANWAMGPPEGKSLAVVLVLGFAVGLLGISGFESSANFIEEQEKGVFPKTLRNMWIAVLVFNPLLSLLASCIMPLDQTYTMVDGVKKPAADFLAQMGEISAGKWLGMMVSIDAVLVLSGAVLTAYVGVTGLMRRMALDRCLPQFFLKENKARGTNHWIIIGFLSLCCSIVWIAYKPPGSGSAHGDVNIAILAGVYTISFLSVMALFAIGNMLLKVKRKRLPRDVKASWPAVLVALVAVLVGLVANAVIDYPQRLTIFGAYFGVSVAVVTVTFLRASILRVALAALAPLSKYLLRTLDEVNNQRVVFFTKGDNLANLNRAALYVKENEQTKRLKVVHVYEDEAAVDRENLAKQLRTVDEVYPELRIDLVLVRGAFGPELIERLSRRMRVPKNYMFLGTPGDRFPHNIAELGGVRLII